MKEIKEQLLEAVKNSEYYELDGKFDEILSKIPKTNVSDKVACINAIKKSINEEIKYNKKLELHPDTDSAWCETARFAYEKVLEIIDSIK